MSSRDASHHLTMPRTLLAFLLAAAIPLPYVFAEPTPKPTPSPQFNKAAFWNSQDNNVPGHWSPDEPKGGLVEPPSKEEFDPPPTTALSNKNPSTSSTPQSTPGTTPTPTPASLSGGLRGPLEDIKSLAYPAPTYTATTINWSYKPGETVAPSASVDDTPASPTPTNIDSHYIISLKDSAAESSMESHWKDMKTLLQKYLANGKNISSGLRDIMGVHGKFNKDIWNGYAGAFPPEMMDALKKSSLVEYIEPDRVIRAAGFRYKGSKGALTISKSISETETTSFESANSTDTSSTNSTTPSASSKAGSLTSLSSGTKASFNTSVGSSVDDQIDPPWGLDRIGHHLKDLVGLFRHLKKAGEGVDIYILDTGVRVSHSEFEGRAIFGEDFTNTGLNDLNGHGTHVAALAAGKTYGVAKGANIIAVKVLGNDGTGSTSIVLKGLEWTVNRMQSRPGVKAVVNLSLGGGGISQALNDYVDRIVANGGVVAVAAGNSNTDACANSPANSPNVLTVGASTQDDYRASFSNFGSCISLYAPGKEIQSAGIASDTASAYESGTSQASPLVAGVLATYMSIYPAITPLEAYNSLIESSFMDVTLSNTTAADPTILLSAIVDKSVDVDGLERTGTMNSLLWNVLRLSFD
ncbi:serine protease [Phlyctochytrium planicorne]|nr:serine protease [Phlyctochytrium planicorne]